MASEEITTVRVVACGDPFGGGLGFVALEQGDKVQATPNTTLLMMPLPTSSQTSTAACICDQNAPGSMPIISTPTT